MVVTGDADRFAVIRALGAGAMGIVYEVHDRKHDSRVALKTLRTVDPGRLYQLKQEFRALSDIAHPNLVTLFDLVSTEDRCFFTMELVEGGVDLLTHVRPRSDRGADLPRPPSLDTLLLDTTPSTSPGLRRRPRRRNTGTCDHQRLRAAMIQLADGVEGLHRAGKLHRDLKPSNVLVDRDGRLVICDFGLVIDVVAAGAGGRSASAVGTAIYMSPEQAANLPLTAASDWYSVGVMLYEALVGLAPFEGNADEVLARKQVDVPRPPSELATGVPVDLEQLCLDLLRRRPVDRPTGDEIRHRLGGAAPAARGTGPRPSATAELVGRELQRAALDDAFRASCEGRPVIATVHGRTGMGKSSLVRQFVDHLARTGAATVFSGACYECETVPYKAVDSLIDALSAYLLAVPRDRIDALLPPEVAVLARVFPVMRRVEALAAVVGSTTAVDPGELRQHAFHALRVLLTRIAAERPVVLWVDDLQWGDVDSAVLLAELVRPPDAPPLLFVGCHRTDDGDVGPFVRAFHGPAQELAGTALDVRDIVVDALTSEDAERLAATLLAADDGRDAATIARESGGCPLFVTELARHAGPSTLSLDAVIRDRVSRLPPESRDLLTVVAVAGRPVPRTVVAAALETADSERRALIELRAERLIRTGGERELDELATYHETIRRAVIGALAPAELRQYHRRVAVALETTDRDDPEALAEHWIGAGRPDIASRYAMTAAERAAEALAFDRAARLYRVALAAPGLDVAQIHAIEVRLAEVLTNAGRGAEAAEVYLRAAANAAPSQALELRRRACLQYLRSGHFLRGTAAIDETLAPAGLRTDSTQARVMASVAFRRAWLRVRGLGFRERPAADIAPERLARIDTCWSVTAAFGMIDSVRGNDLQSRHLLLALATGEPYRVCRGLALEIPYSALAGGEDDRRTAGLVRTATGMADRLGDPFLVALTTLMTGIAAFLRGRWGEARALCDAAERRFRLECTGVAGEIDTAQAFALGALVYQGDLPELGRRVPWILADAYRRGDLFALNAVRRGRANMCWLVNDDPDSARRALHDAIQTWPRAGFNPQHYFELLAEGQVDLYCDVPDVALQRTRGRWRAMRSSQLLRVQTCRTEMWCLRARCALAVAAGSASGRRELLAQARADARRIERDAMPWSRPLAGLLRAGLAAATGDDETAVAALELAERELVAAGMALHAAVAARRRGELVGGDDGRAAIAAADAWMIGYGVRRPAQICAMIAPGFDPR